MFSLQHNNQEDEPQRSRNAVSISSTFVATSCARSPNTLDWGLNGFIAYGSSNNICVLFPPTETKPSYISATYCAHCKDVTCVKWVKLQDKASAVQSQRDDLNSGFCISADFLLLKDDDTILTLCGHTDWITGLEFQATVFYSSDKEILLASCSQDCFIRLWKIRRERDGEQENKADKIEMRTQTFQLSSVGVSYGVSLEAVLSGHESWIYSVKWDPMGKNRLLSSSMDKCFIIWTPDHQSGVWLEHARMGEVGGQAAGYFGAVFAPDGLSVLAHSYQGGMHLWRVDGDGVWSPNTVPSGHFGSVEDISWDLGGGYLMSCSCDQTTRVFAPWLYKENQVSYHEISRAQVHGHDLKCLAVIDGTRFVSGAEEKIPRAFMAPKSFIERYCALTKRDPKKTFSECPISGESASVPALGLSNKALYQQDLVEDGVAKTPTVWSDLNDTSPPTEDRLMQETLWPEVHKLYGHGYELFCVASNRKGTVIASACKATKVDQASILLWDTDDWQLKGRLESHSLTVTELRNHP